MKKFNSFIVATVFAGSIFYSCDNAEVAPSEEPISLETMSQIKSLGFSTEGVIRFEEGYLVENDIYLTDASIASMSEPNYIPTVEQYSTNELVCGSRVITIYAPEEGATSGGGGKGKKGGGGSGGYSPAMIAGLDEAISRYNSENLTISFQRVTSASGADIVMTRLSKRDERQGVLGSAGFPTNCNPYGEIKMSGVLESSYGLSTNGIATIIAHEMGHCIGFRHTDFFDRSISCGGGTANEGAGSIGANHIPGTPTGADLQGAGSWMLACTDGGNRPFTNADKTALDYLY
ncbi:M57 family metalloprotease [Fulvivirga lutea]|uniref:Protease B n=1 Tax=Fulvivirga lutea TaxID=2810512 RepID=A0A974WKE7_9BACT|nr:M57 family metalloprotease [Fulvivirga lutea]QSE98842.1 protease B [Fulvivirga lutea]